MNYIPQKKFEFESERLLFRTIVKEDLEQVRELHNHPEVVSKLTDIRPVNQIEQEEWFVKVSSSRRSYRLIARHRETNQLVGVFRIDKIDQVNQNAEIGLDIHPMFHRKGYGFEIYNKMLEVLFMDWNLHRVYLQTLETNVAANSLYLKLGMKYEGRARQAIYRKGRYEDTILYGLIKSEWSTI